MRAIISWLVGYAIGLALFGALYWLLQHWGVFPDMIIISTAAAMVAHALRVEEEADERVAAAILGKDCDND